MQKIKKLFCLLVLLCVMPLVFAACDGGFAPDGEDTENTENTEDTQDANIVDNDENEETVWTTDDVTALLAINGTENVNLLEKLGKFSGTVDEVHTNLADATNIYWYKEIIQVDYCDGEYQRYHTKGKGESYNDNYYMNEQKIYYSNSRVVEQYISQYDGDDGVITCNQQDVTIHLDQLPASFVGELTADEVWEQARVSVLYEDMVYIDRYDWNQFGWNNAYRDDANHTYCFECDRGAGVYQVSIGILSDNGDWKNITYKIVVERRNKIQIYTATKIPKTFIYCLDDFFSEQWWDYCSGDVQKEIIDNDYTLTLKMDVKCFLRWMFTVLEQPVEAFEQFYARYEQCPVPDWYDQAICETKLFFDNQNQFIGFNFNAKFIAGNEYVESEEYLDDAGNIVTNILERRIEWQQGEFLISVRPRTEDIQEPDWVTAYKATVA